MYRQECALLALIFLPASYPCGSMHAPFFCAFHALAVDDGGSRTGFSLLSFATLFISAWWIRSNVPSYVHRSK